MEKEIKIGNKDIKLHSSIFTLIEYKNVFGKELFSDLKSLENLKSSKKELNISTMIESILKLTYILHRPFTEISFNKFLMSLDMSFLTNEEQISNLSKAVIEMIGPLNKNEASAPQL